jgi:hypothetical protein
VIKRQPGEGAITGAEFEAMNYDFIQIGEDSLLGNNYSPGK